AMDQAFSEMPDACIVSGLAGALKADYLPGRVLAAKTVANLPGTRILRSDSELLSRAATSGAKVADRILVSDRVIATAAEKKQLGKSGIPAHRGGPCVLAAAAQR